MSRVPAQPCPAPRPGHIPMSQLPARRVPGRAGHRTPATTARAASGAGASTTASPATAPAGCARSMEPIAVTVRDDGKWASSPLRRVRHRAHLNRIAGDDNPHALMKIAVRPLEQPAVPARVDDR